MAIERDRVERLLSTIVEASEGNYETRVPLDDVDDELLEIEVGINYLLDELALKHQQNLADQQALIEQATRIQTQTQELVAALSTPIMVLWPGVLALPLIGHFDLGRAEDVTSTLLDRVTSERASHVILDLTGIENIANNTVAALLRMIRAMGLLGVRCMLTGVHPRSAQQIVEIGVDIDQLQTHARVSDALVQVLSEKHRKT